MKEEGEKTQRKKWVYTRQQYENRYGFEDGKTYVWEVSQEVKPLHYDLGKTQIFNGKCEIIEEEKKENDGERAPWMEIALGIAKEMKGCEESKEPMYSKAKSYLRYCGNQYEPTDGVNGPWCAAFMNWCIGQTINSKTSKPYKHSKSASSQAPLNNEKYIKIEEPIYGSIVVYRKASDGTGHTGFLYGKTTSGEYILLGGNQDQTVRFDAYGEYTSSSKTKKLYGFYIPADYEVKEIDKLKDTDIYANEDVVNSKYGITIIKSTGKTN
ncbi:MAG: hypothetical protein LBE36_11560 [Flavobacteriaceae bacterium]|jgi:uncharacterized protein (TIGR02594 family)|nr:hypothetical protein [Flavobacteriaceae bacterium]